MPGRTREANQRPLPGRPVNSASFRFRFRFRSGARGPAITLLIADLTVFPSAFSVSFRCSE